MDITWRFHDTSEKKIRYWRNDWYGDTFEICSVSEFFVLKEFAQKLCISVEHAKDDSISHEDPELPKKIGYQIEAIDISTAKHEPTDCWVTVVSVMETEVSPVRIGIGIGKYPGTADIDTIIMWDETHGMWSKVPSEVFSYELRSLHGCLSVPGELARKFTG